MYKGILNYRSDMAQRAYKKALLYLSSLGITRYRAIIFGSFARGDFDFYSDIDLLIISNELPEGPMERLSFLAQKRHLAPEIEPVGWTEREYEQRRASGDPFLEVLHREGILIEEKGYPYPDNAFRRYM